MKRGFCDVCGQYALQGSPNIDEQATAKSDEFGYVFVEVRFKFVEYPAVRVGGPPEPDLCGKCRLELIRVATQDRAQVAS